MRCRPTDTVIMRLERWGWCVADAGCWVFRGSRNKDGYGVMTVRGKRTLTHRLAYETWVGPIPDGLIVRHKCDNPPCINPEHLEVGTHRENSEDMVRRGRLGALAKLSAGDVAEIRASTCTRQALSQRFGVSPSTIDKLINRETWRSITP